MRMKAFKFGVEFSPWWFLDKVEHKLVEYIHEGGKVIGCRYYDVNNREVEKYMGDYITRDSLYKEEPKRREGGMNHA